MTYYPSYWERSILLKTFDFIILGAGIIGKQIAIKIKTKHPAARIALVDRSPLPYGASTRNAGFACFGSLTEILDDLNHSTLKDIMELADKRYRGINKLVSDFGAGNIGYVPTGGYEVFENDQADELNTALGKFDFINNELKSTTGLDHIFEIKENTNFGFNCIKTKILNKHEGMLNTGMLNETIANKAHTIGIVPFYGFSVSSIRKMTKGYELSDNDGMTIYCNQLVVTNNAFAGQLLPELDVKPARGQVIITKPLNNIPFNGIFHSDKGYVYFRNIDNRILIGGGRNHFKVQEETFQFEGSENVRNYLENYLRTIILPGRSFETDMHWSGIMAMGKEKLPISGRINDHLLVCVRMSGMGVALGPVLSDEIAELV